MTQQIPLDPAWRADHPQEDGTNEVCADLAYRRLAIVNVIFFGPPGAGDRGWVLIDAGLFGTKQLIPSAAAERFGANARPSAIVLTHGHFDHVGVLEDLAEEWDTPVYAHPLEHPYLDGRAAYPPPDPSVGGGLIALSSLLFPTDPVNVGPRLHPLPSEDSVPGMPGWRWIHTPGHAPGHVSLWREADRTLIAGDAFVTTRQESAYAAIMQEPELHGPPTYFTIDWAAARESVRCLDRLSPERVVTGHGRSMQGAGFQDALHRLARDFDRIAVPQHSRYRDAPASADDGSAYRQS
jgi:glyoxylase-like metal-dependent hydrolase (beta-lactamase superfamily II)